MALTDEDLKFTIKVDSDTTKVKGAFADLAADLEKMQHNALLPTEKMVTAIDYQLAVNKAITDEMAKQERLVSRQYSQSGKNLVSDVQNYTGYAGNLLPQEKLLTSIDDLLSKGVNSWQQQRDMIGDINAYLHDMNVQRLLPTADMLSGIDASLKNRKTHIEELPEALAAPGKLESLARLFSKGLNVRQLAGSAIGAAAGGGQGGALGAAAGGAGMEALAGALGPLGVAAGVAAGGVLLAVDAIGKMVSSVKSLANEIAQFAGVSSPAAIYRWEYTVRDLEGVIGRRLVPVLDAMTDSLRGFANTLDAVLPSASTMEWLTRTAKGMFDAWTYGLFKAESATRDFLKGVLSATSLGILGGGSGDSFGAAARPAHFSSVEEYEKGFQQSALSASSMQSIPEKQLTVLEQIRDAIINGDAARPGPHGRNANHGQDRALLGW